MPPPRSVLTALALALLAHGVSADVLPAGSTLSVRLTSAVSSRTAKAGDPIETVLIAPACLGQRELLHAGSRIVGRVVDTEGRKDRPGLLLRFDRLIDAQALSTPIQARVAEVDNARETVLPEGRIVGLPKVTSPPSKAHALLLLAAHAHLVTLAMFEAGRIAVKKTQHSAIRYGPGVELTLVTEAPATVPDGPSATDPSLPDEKGLAPLVDALPLFTIAPRVARPADLTNVVAVGSADELRSAFEAAGWARAETMSWRACAKAFFALTERHSYKTAPVSSLELEGRRPDVVFEKQNNTLSKRHHVRFWKQREQWLGRTVWLGAATHDVGIVFDRPGRRFTHQVDTEIDREREKLVDDLRFADAGLARTLVARPLAPRAFKNAAGVDIVTDGQIAVVVLKGIDTQ